MTNRIECDGPECYDITASEAFERGLLDENELMDAPSGWTSRVHRSGCSLLVATVRANRPAPAHEAAEASTLGLAPGEWPMTIRVEGVSYRRGDVEIDDEGDITQVAYHDHLGGTLVVWND